MRKTISLADCLGFTMLIGVAAVANAQTTRYVDAESGAANPDGLSWCTAYVDLQDALGDAFDGDEIRVAEGLYIPGVQTAAFEINAAITLAGGYAGCGAPDPDARNIRMHETILSGDIFGNDDPVDFPNDPTYTDNSYNVVRVNVSGGEIDGFTISGGNDPNNSGGGVRINGRQVRIRNCTIVGNASGWEGGGIALLFNNSNLTLLDSRVHGNFAYWGGSGGGIMVVGSSRLLAINAAITANEAGQGGGVRASSGATVREFTNCLIANNVAGSYGGIFGGTLKLANCTVVDNEATSGHTGGAKCLAGSSIDNSIFWGNRGTDDRYGQLDVTGTTTVAYSDIEDGYNGIRGRTNVVDWEKNGNLLGTDDDYPKFLDPDGPDDLLGTLDDDYRIGALSPCIDAADNAAVPLDVEDIDGDGWTGERTPLDLARLARFTDDPATDDTGNPDPAYGLWDIVDIGAHEFARCGVAETTVVADPPNGSIDARQPVNLAGDAEPAWESVMLAFNPPTLATSPSDFVVTVTGGASPVAVNTVTQGGVVTVFFDREIPLAEWTRVTHACSGRSVCLGRLPADVTGDATSSPADILALIDCLNDVRACERWQVDVDHSGQAGPPDILRVIDLLNGAGPFAPWFGVSLPDNPCTVSSSDASVPKGPPSDTGSPAFPTVWEPDLADSFMAMLADGTWAVGSDWPDVESTILSVSDWVGETAPLSTITGLVDAVQDPDAQFFDSQIVKLVPTIVMALEQDDPPGGR